MHYCELTEHIRSSSSEQSIKKTKGLEQSLAPRNTRLIVGITSRCTKEKLKWLIDLLNSARFSGLVSEVRHLYISNRNSNEWRKEVNKCSVVILYHTVHHGGLNITDIDAALYNDELLYLSQSLGQGNVMVVLDDLGQTDDDKRQIILKNQPSIGLYSCELLLIPEKQKETAFLTKCRRLQPVQPRGKDNVIVVIDDLEDNSEEEKRRILQSQPSIERLARETFLFSEKEKKSKHGSYSSEFLFTDQKLMRKLQEIKEVIQMSWKNLQKPEVKDANSAIPRNQRPEDTRVASQGTYVTGASGKDPQQNKTKQQTSSDRQDSSNISARKNLKESLIRPLLQKHKISIFSRASSTNYEWLISQLKGSSLLEKDIHSVYISNNYSQFLQKTSECTFAILYHTRNHGRINITDVTDSLYDKELEYLSRKLGKDNVIVVIDDLEISSEEEKRRILQNQPSIERLARETFLFSQKDKKSKYGSYSSECSYIDEGLMRKLQRIKEVIKKNYPPQKPPGKDKYTVTTMEHEELLINKTPDAVGSDFTHLSPPELQCYKKSSQGNDNESPATPRDKKQEELQTGKSYSEPPYHEECNQGHDNDPKGLLSHPLPRDESTDIPTYAESQGQHSQQPTDKQEKTATPNNKIQEEQQVNKTPGEKLEGSCSRRQLPSELQGHDKNSEESDNNPESTRGQHMSSDEHSQIMIYASSQGTNQQYVMGPTGEESQSPTTKQQTNSDRQDSSNVSFSANEKKTSSEITPTYLTTNTEKKHKISIISKAPSSNYHWLVSQLKGPIFRNVMKDVSSVYISNKYSQFLHELSDCTFAILYHTCNHGCINIMDITDKELEDLSQKLGKDNVIVVIDDLEDSSEEEKRRILQSQPSIERLVRETFLFSEKESKHGSSSSEFSFTDQKLMRKLQEMKAVIQMSWKHFQEPQAKEEHKEENSAIPMNQRQIYQAVNIKPKPDSVDTCVASQDTNEPFLMAPSEKDAGPSTSKALKPKESQDTNNMKSDADVQTVHHTKPQKHKISIFSRASASQHQRLLCHIKSSFRNQMDKDVCGVYISNDHSQCAHNTSGRTLAILFHIPDDEHINITDATDILSDKELEDLSQKPGKDNIVVIHDLENSSEEERRRILQNEPDTKRPDEDTLSIGQNLQKTQENKDSPVMYNEQEKPQKFEVWLEESVPINMSQHIEIQNLKTQDHQSQLLTPEQNVPMLKSAGQNLQKTQENKDNPVMYNEQEKLQKPVWFEIESVPQLRMAQHSPIQNLKTQENEDSPVMYNEQENLQKFEVRLEDSVPTYLSQHSEIQNLKTQDHQSQLLTPEKKGLMLKPAGQHSQQPTDKQENPASPNNNIQEEQQVNKTPGEELVGSGSGLQGHDKNSEESDNNPESTGDQHLSSDDHCQIMIYASSQGQHSQESTDKQECPATPNNKRQEEEVNKTLGEELATPMDKRQELQTGEIPEEESVGSGFRHQICSKPQCHKESREENDNDPERALSHHLPPEIPAPASSQDKKEIFDEMLLKMKMKAHRNNKLTLQDVLEIGPESVKGMNSWSSGNPVLDYLYKLQLLDATARNPCMGLEKYKTNLDMEPDASNVIHPLDILCVLLHCSDTLLQQYILSNMSMCQFSLPLLLPGFDGPDYTFMLWAMRDIVKRWIPQSLVASKGFTEDHLVQIQMPVFSFVRLGTCNISKSKVLNEVLSPAQQYHDFFTHRNMEGGNVPRQISSGLVEIFWYFPAGKDYLDVFTEPVAVTNLRGDLESNLKQFHFLSQISSSVFIIAESITNDQYQLLHNIKDSKTTYFFIIAPTGGKMDTDTQEFLKQLLSPNRTNILVMNKATNEAAFVKNIRLAIVKLGQNNSQNLNLENMVQIAEDFKIFIDENSEECQKAKEDARKITEKIQDVVEYKRETMKLQGDPWKELAKLEKEMCQMKRQGTNNGEEYKYRIYQRCSEIRKQQYTIRGPNDITSFITAITNKSHVERWYFLKWMKFYLNLAARNKLSGQNEYNNELIYLTNKELAGLDQRISDGSLGVEHFMRELSQLYEAEYFTVKEKTDRNNSGLPGIAADLLLDGFPLELIDGDASNIPLQWVTDVLTELDNKTGGGCRLRVITVLGKQNTGTSALLNIIFGLQIPIPSGYCIHGAFMTLIKVKENIKGKLGFDFILVIDTKGLKTSRLDDRCEHENELLTLAIGLSDITIINMDTENTDNIKNILQIVVQAFLRVKETGKKPRCQMVHQDVRDVFDHENNMRDRKKFLEQLNEMTRLAASIERKYDITAFSDIMKYDLEQHDWYIPGLWHGVPPMAPVSSGYSKKICELKRNLFQFLKKSSKKAQTIPEFVKWISSFWNSLKDESFIFSFRNNQSVMAYNQLAKKYSELEQNFSKEVHEWVLKTEKTIKEQSPEQLEMMVNQFKEQISFIVTTQEKKMLSELQNICQILTGLVPLIEGFQEHFFNIVQNLKKKLETSSIESCKQTIRIKNDLYKIQNMHETCIKAIEKKVSSICKANKKEVSNAELMKEFDNLWCEIASDLNVIKLPKRDIEREMLDTLTKEMRSRGSSVIEKLHCIKCLPEKEQVKDTFGYSKFKLFKTSILEKCSNYLRKAVHIDHDYDETYCRELLNIVTASCAHDDAKDLHITAETELELMLSALGSAVGEFQQMHNDFIKNNDPYYHFDQQKQKYSDMFNKIFSEKIEGQNCGKQCFEHYLKPALVDHIYKTYIKEIVNILSSIAFSKYTFCFFQYTILEQLLEESDFNQYLEYCRNYENYSKKRLLKFILKNCITCRLHYETLFSVTKKMRECLKDEEILQSHNAQEFLQCVSDKLKNELDISQNEVKDVFQTFPNIKEFVACVEKSLKDTEDEIRSEIESPDNKSLFSKATLDHLDEVFKNMPRCKTQCQFCKASCDVEDIGHKVHSSSVHQPEGLGGKISATTEMFDNETCSTNIAGNLSLTSSVSNGNSVSPKDYQTYYPEWFTATNLSTEASDYWKYVLKEFDEQFAEAFKVQPSAYPKEWNKITKEQARVSLRAAFHIQ